MITGLPLDFETEPARPDASWERGLERVPSKTLAAEQNFGYVSWSWYSFLI